MINLEKTYKNPTAFLNVIEEFVLTADAIMMMPFRVRANGLPLSRAQKRRIEGTLAQASRYSDNCRYDSISVV